MSIRDSKRIFSHNCGIGSGAAKSLKCGIPQRIVIVMGLKHDSLNLKTFLMHPYSKSHQTPPPQK